jgi:hypothetical protein
MVRPACSKCPHSQIPHVRFRSELRRLGRRPRPKSESRRDRAAWDTPGNLDVGRQSGHAIVCSVQDHPAVRELREADLAAHYNQTPPRNRRPNRNCDRTPAAFLVPQDDPPTQGSNSGPHLYPAKTRLRTAQCLFYFLAALGAFPGARRIVQPEALARLCGASATLKAVGRRMRCSKCGTKGAEVVAVARPRPRGVPNDSH